jgi:membrane-bound ClpP family serine protease
MFIPLILIIMIIVPIPILIKNMLSNRNAYRGILEGAIAAMAGVASLLMMFWILTGVSFFELINEGMNSVTLEDMKFAERYAMLGMEMPEPEELQLMLDYVKETMSLAVPGILILLCLVISYINYGIISWILSKSGQRITTLPPMRSFSLPKSIVIGSLLIYILAYLSASAGIIGFSTPGTFLPEVTGAISLVLALFGMGMFEINFFAVVMIVLGIALLIAEIFTPTYGVLGVGGIISITLGIIFLPVEPLVASNWIVQFRLMAIGIGIVASIFLLVVLAGISKLRKLPPKKGFGEFTNEFGIVTEDLDPEGYILVNGELWRARAVNDDISISAGTRVKIIKRQQMIFIVEPAEE